MRKIPKTIILCILAEILNFLTVYIFYLTLNNPLFFEGERLIAAEFHGKTCVARPFDTAETVAKRTGTRKEEVIRLNGTDKFFPGQNVILSDYDE